VIDSLSGPSFSSLRIQTDRGRDLTIPLPEGKALTRSVLDQALVRAAVDRGVCFVPDVTARLVAPAAAADLSAKNNASRAVSLRARAGKVSQIRARVVVVADGLGHPSLTGLEEFSSVQSRRSRIGLGAVLESGPAGHESGVVNMAVGRGGYVGMVRAEGGRLVIAAAVDPEFLREQPTRADAVASILRDSRCPIPEGVFEAPWSGTPALSQNLTHPVGRRVFVIGDSAGYVEPFTGEGIAWALDDAASVPRFVGRGVVEWTAEIEAEWLGARKMRVVRDQRLSRVTSRILRSPLGFDALIRVLTLCPSLADAGIARMNPAGWTETETRA
jgi:flavin-dependent dehydrogenase